MSEPCSIERDGPLAVLTFEHPPVNLFDRAVFDGLERAVASWRPTPRAAC
jgi:enoyl-CoA hydratase/carnithine racemase